MGMRTAQARTAIERKNQRKSERNWRNATASTPVGDQSSSEFKNESAYGQASAAPSSSDEGPATSKP